MFEAEAKDGNVVVRYDWATVTVLPGQHVWISLPVKDADKLAEAIQAVKKEKS